VSDCQNHVAPDPKSRDSVLFVECSRVGPNGVVRLLQPEKAKGKRLMAGELPAEGRLNELIKHEGRLLDDVTSGKLL